jgi:uncharacterized protein (DUF427 family)
MTLTLGTGPFGPQATGRFNFTREGPAHVLFLDPSDRRVRVMFAGEVVADSRRAKLLHETGLLPVWYIPMDDVRMDLLEPTDQHSHCPFKGDASYWTVRVGAKVAENAVWGYPEPLESTPPIAGHVAFYQDRMDAWYEEDEQVHGHPRDPYHRVDIRPSSRAVRVTIDGDLIAESTRPLLVFETGLPVRYYLPPEDVGTDLLESSATTTYCPYKGDASYLARGGRDVAWVYREPLDGAQRISGHVAFLGDRAVVEVDGEPLPPG